MTQCVDSLRALVEEKIQSLKKNKYLANADWIFIEKNFQLENPHAPNMINNGNRNRNSIDYNIRCSFCDRTKNFEDPFIVQFFSFNRPLLSKISVKSYDFMYYLFLL